jgi:hypothetical protein
VSAHKAALDEEISSRRGSSVKLPLLERGILKVLLFHDRISNKPPFIELVNVIGLMKEQGPSVRSTDTKAGHKKNHRQSIANRL